MAQHISRLLGGVRKRSPCVGSPSAPTGGWAFRGGKAARSVRAQESARRFLPLPKPFTARPCGWRCRAGPPRRDAQGYGELAVEQGLGALHEARGQLGEVPLVTGFGVHARDGVYERLRLLPADDRAHEYLRVHGYAYCAAVYYEFTHLVHFGLTRHFPGLLAALYIYFSTFFKRM